MKGNLAACLAVTLEYEGGWSDHPKDPGGATMKGVTLKTFRTYKPGATKAELRAISPAVVEAIYRDGYWSPIRGDDLPDGFDLAVFDYGVNSGPSRSIKDLQRAVGVKVDGKMGKETIGAALKRDSAGAGKEVIKAICARRLSFMQGLAIWKTFKRGWSRRVADVEAKSVAMWLAAMGVSKPSRRVELDIEREAASGKAKVQQHSANGTAAGGVTVGGGDAAVSGDINWLLVSGVAVVVIVVAGVLILKARQNRERAEAYDRVTKAV